MPIRLVFPGDLITAGDWNELIAIVNTLEVRVAELEKGGGGDDELRITQVLPPGVVTAGDTIRIVGSGFGFLKGTHSVFFGPTRASIFGDESTDTVLVVQIPDPVAGATPAGTPITMTVGNLSEFVTWPLTIKSRPVQVGGALEFGFLAATPATPTVGAAITYTFRLASLSNASVNVLITPDLDLPTAPPGVVEVHADGQVRTDRTVALPAGATKTIGVKITKIPDLPTGTTFNLSVTASAPGVQSQTAVLPPQMVGVAGESPDPTITNLTFSTVAEGTATFAAAPAGDTVEGTLSIPGTAPTRVTIQLDATFANIPAGTSAHYLPSAEVVTGTGWSAARNAILTPTRYTVPAPGAQEFPGFDIDAPSSGQAVIRFTLTHEEATTNNKRSITLRVQRS